MLTGEMVYCEYGTINKEGGQYLEAGQGTAKVPRPASRNCPTSALGVPYSCVCIGSMIAVCVYSIYTSDE